MRLGTRLVVLVLFLLVIGVLAALNTNFLTYPHTLYLGFATYPDLPLGLLLLTVMLVPLLVFYFWAGVTKLRAQADSAKLLRDMEGLRASLDAQEGSRFAQLQAHLDQRLNALPEKSAQPAVGPAELAALERRVEDLQRDINLQLAQMDDYLKTKLGR